jgi:hypothetical protein
MRTSVQRVALIALLLSVATPVAGAICEFACGLPPTAARQVHVSEPACHNGAGGSHGGATLHAILFDECRHQRELPIPTLTVARDAGRTRPASLFSGVAAPFVLHAARQPRPSPPITTSSPPPLPPARAFVLRT